ncbi:hypothetical protein PENSPDRAFT_651759 [Peniophora sp. CONT]|nr:hypothetical protein PENSPDRAFT_651759 [Peniophora sp. CONT]
MGGTNDAVLSEQRPAIHKLPSDLLFLIFRRLCAIYPVGKDIDHKLGWIVAAHVCSHWRRVAINECAPLWAQSICALPKAIPTVLERACDARLTLELTEPEYASENPTILETDALRKAIVDVAGQRSQQIHRITFAFPNFKAQKQSLGSYGGPWVTPEPGSAIDIENVRTSVRGEQASRLSGTILDALMGKALPSLRHLEIVYEMYTCLVNSMELSDYTAFSAPSLVTLRLFRQRIPADTLYNILRSTPLLETLDVQWNQEDGPPMLASLSRDLETLSLPHLVNVSLGSTEVPFLDLCSLWKLIRPHPDVSLRFLGTLFTLEGLSELLTELATQLQRESGDTLTVRARTAPTSGVSLSSSSTPCSGLRHCVGIWTACRVTPMFTTIMIEHLFAVADHTRIRILDFDLAGSIAEETVVQLARLTDLKELRVNFGIGGPLLSLNYLSLRAPPLFPALETLVLKSINSDEFTAWRRGGFYAANSILERRKEAGVPVSKLVLRGARSAMEPSLDGDYESEMLRELSEHVYEVVDERCDHT